MRIPPGSAGYAENAAAFVESSLRLSFAEVNRLFLPFLPTKPASVLDLGSGVGQNSAAMAELGHDVVAVEPLPCFLEAAMAAFGETKVCWMQDSLPVLSSLEQFAARFEFILIDGVWHHLSPDERHPALRRVYELLSPSGCCAVSLRNGPAGAGSRVYATDGRETLQAAALHGLIGSLCSENEPSIYANKSDVTWTRLVLRRV